MKKYGQFVFIYINGTSNSMDLKDMVGLYYGTLGKRVDLFSTKNDTEARGCFFLPHHSSLIVTLILSNKRK